MNPKFKMIGEFDTSATLKTDGPVLKTDGPVLRDDLKAPVLNDGLPDHLFK